MGKNKSDPTLGERLQELEVRYDLRPVDMAKLLQMTPNDYHSKYRSHAKAPTAWQRLALDLIDLHGVKKLMSRLK